MNSERGVDDATLHLVRTAAERLVDDLQTARDQTAVDAALDRCLAVLASTGIWGKDNQGPSHELWRMAGPWLEHGDLQRRARFKPRGYAGDFEMQADFWDRRAVDSPLGRLFDDYFLRQTAVEAVRARMELAAEMIAARCRASRHDEFRVTSVGSGPAIDLTEAARRLPSDARSRLRLTLVDMDDAALDAAGTRLASVVAAEQIVVRRENLYRLPTLRRAAESFTDVDFILCSGLNDYLSDEAAVAQLRLFWNGLRDGGLAMVGNFAPHNPTRAYMEWIGNWYLIYRTADELTQLATAAGIPSERRSVVAERTGCDLFLLAERSGGAAD
jgi:hypothetical protein